MACQILSVVPMSPERASARGIGKHHVPTQDDLKTVAFSEIELFMLSQNESRDILTSGAIPTLGVQGKVIRVIEDACGHRPL